MRVLILGHTGLLGRELVKQYSSKYTVEWLPRTVWDARDNPIDSVLHREIASFCPTTVINCVGITKAKCNDPIDAIEVNSLFPHRLAELTSALGAQLIHISTDCVGEKDLYGRSKALGEVNGPKAMTLRTSFIGRHPTDKTGLVEWFLEQKGDVPGFWRTAYYGLTTIELARAIERVLVANYTGATFNGVWEVGGPRISKYDLLLQLQQAYRTKSNIYASGDVMYDRTLHPTPFNNVFNYRAPAWFVMLRELAEEYPR